jgi:hypothetical protein
MSQVPGVANATLDDAKITQYLLDPSHPIGAAKAKFFASFGFLKANWPDLKRALLDHPQMHAVASQTPNAYGQMYEVSCSLVSPDGRNPRVVSIWIIEPSNPNPKFVTAYAGP